MDALTVYGGELIAGGAFTTAGGGPCARIARWNGASWQPLGSGLGGAVSALGTHGGELIASGGFLTAGGEPCVGIARWDGATWRSLGGITPTGVPALATFRGRLIAGGKLSLAGGVLVKMVAEWDGVQWAPVGFDPTDDIVTALAVFDDGRGLALYAGGRFQRIRGVDANRIARWDGVQWSPVGSGTDGQVTAMTVFEGRLIVGGTFKTAGGIVANSVASWDGKQWSAVGSGFPSDAFYALAVFNGRLYASNYNIPFGSRPGSGNVYEWDGAQWRIVWYLGIDNCVLALTVFDDGAGPALYAGCASGAVGKWNGAGWTPVGGGYLSGAVSDLVVYDDGTGPGLYAATEDSSGYHGAVFKWDGQQHWSAVGGAMDGPVYGLAVLDDGQGPTLFAAGRFTTAGAVRARGIAKWDGSQWRALGLGLGAYTAISAPDSFSPMAVYDEELYVGGNIATAGGQPSAYWARWDKRPPTGDLNCDGSIDFGDVNPFVLALTNPAAYALKYPDCDPALADINRDGLVDFGDINPFVRLLTQ